NDDNHRPADSGGSHSAAPRASPPRALHHHLAPRRRARRAVQLPVRITENLMLKQPERRFLYKAHAVALAASFTKPQTEFLEAQAACSLPVTGGLSSSRVENFRFRDIVSFRAAQSHASGTYNPQTGAYNTLVTSEIEGFSIMGVVTADRIVARLASKHFI